ncbi:MAG TPA: 2-amino-4-hydroxy-6-hydroxymethyldihydropteridine diphosphokinase [Terracidiphilus sp.]
MRTAYIALGANLPSSAGPPASTLRAVVERLGGLGPVTRRSSLYSTEAVGLAEQPRFVNAVVELQTELEPEALLKHLLAIEQEFGRDRSSGIPNGPRTLDLDILVVDNLAVRGPELELPHPRLAERKFVLVPLKEIAPQLMIADNGKTVAELLENLESRRKDNADAVVRMDTDDWRTAARP